MPTTEMRSRSWPIILRLVFLCPGRAQPYGSIFWSFLSRRKNRELAYQFVNFLLDTENARQNALYVKVSND
ncbi:MAG: hypothetical protein AB1611_21090 [bacterium]